MKKLWQFYWQLTQNPNSQVSAVQKFGIREISPKYFEETWFWWIGHSVVSANDLQWRIFVNGFLENWNLLRKNDLIK